MLSPAEHPPLLTDDPHDRETAANTHPGDWHNPHPAPRYDMVVVGGGTAGLVGAGTASLLGAKVALIERAYTGGDCLITGCVPSKALLRCARAAAEMRDGERFGIRAEGIDIDFGRALEYVRAARSQISHADAAGAFRDRYGVDLFFGNASFTGSESIEVDGQEFRFKRAIIATGSSPVVPDVPGLAAAGYFTNETIFNLTQRPERLAIIGGGPLGCELAQAFARLGSHVTLIEHNKDFLHREDREAAAILLAVFWKEGVTVRLGTDVAEVSRTGDVTRLRIGQEIIDADAVLVGVGREPHVSSLGLDRAGVKHDSHGVTVDDFLRTSNRCIFAAGDVCLKEKFTHGADASARLAVQNALLLPMKRWSRQIVPHVTYTEPEIAQVGPMANGESNDLRVYKIPLREVDRAVTDGEANGFLKVAVHAGSGKIVSATIVGTRAGEMLTTLTAAMNAKQRLASLSDVIVPYPTQSDAIKKAADAALQDRLAGWRLRLARWWVRWR